MAETKVGGVGIDLVERGMAQIFKGGVITDVATAEQAKVAGDAGTVAAMALERIPVNIRAEDGVTCMSDPDPIDGITNTASIPVMAKVYIGHPAETQVLQNLGVDYIDESEVLTSADYGNHINKWDLMVPLVCGATNLDEVLRRISGDTAMTRFKGEADTDDVSDAMTHVRTMTPGINRLASMQPDEAFYVARELQVPYPLVKEVAGTEELPVTLFTAGGIAIPADAALITQLGAGGVFVGSGIFKSGDPAKWAVAIVKATTRFNEPEPVAEVSQSSGEATVGINVHDPPAAQCPEDRGRQA